MNGPEELPQGQCVCGRSLPDEPLSDWACSEPCQSAWMHHHADPAVYPHPREIREAADARVASGYVRPPVRVHLPGAGETHPDVRLTQIADGTAIDVDGQEYVRVGAHWQPAGAWSPLRSELATLVEYRRWCPRCRERRSMVEVSGPPGSALDGTQICAVCDHHWQGRPLRGVVETRGVPWPGLRLRLTDGQRSTTLAFTEAEILSAGVEMAARIERCWRRLERNLCGGVAEADQADERTRERAANRVRHSWHWPSPPHPADVRPDLSPWLQ